MSQLTLASLQDVCDEIAKGEREPQWHHPMVSLNRSRVFEADEHSCLICNKLSPFSILMPFCPKHYKEFFDAIDKESE